MMVSNRQMKNILHEIDFNTIECDYSYPMKKMVAVEGEPYWSVLREDIPAPYAARKQLADHEWDINEVYINDSENIKELVYNGLCIVRAWQSEMTKQWPSVQFDICLSVDYGEIEISPSVTLRFWAVRNGYHYIQPVEDELELFKINPVLIECVN